MGSLSNLYISQSYVSLIHLGSDSFITTQSVELQDGLGNGLGIFVNSLGDVNISGDISASNIPAEITSKGEFNAYTASTNIRLNNLESTTASLNSSVTQLNASSASQQVSINALNVYTASTSTASIINSLSNLNQFTSSANVRLNNLESTSASVDISIANLNTTSASVNTSITNLNASSASQQISINNLNAKTGSYATTGSNTFVGIQVINAALTASVARIANLNYPTTDGTFTGQVLQTNAAGTLSFGNVNAVFENIRNGELTTITKGTPLYVSGAQGDTPIVYRADATNPAKMPVTFLAMENIASNATGRGITLGLVTGIDMTGYPAGTQLWVDGLGLLTDVRPTGSTDIVQPIAIVTKTGNGGQINVLNPGPILLPNIQTGYVWVGNGSNQPISVATSSLVTNINTGSLLVTASAVDNVITFTKGDASTFNVTVNVSGSQATIPQGTVSSSAQVLAYGIFVTTSSFNPYTSSTNIRLSNLETTTASLNTSITNLNLSSASQQVSINALNVFTASQSTASLVTSITNLNSATQSLFSSASLALVTASFDNGTRNLTFTKGDTTQFSVNIPDVSGSTGNFVTTSSFNAYTASNDQRVSSLEANSASVNISINNLNTTTASLLVETNNLELFSASALVSINSLNAKTASFATTGSNTFIGNQIITGSVIISSSATYDLEITGAARIVSENLLQINTLGSNTFNLNTTKDASVNAENYIFGSTASVSSVYVGVYDDPNFNTDVELKLSADSNGISFNDWDNGSTFSYIPFITLTPNLGNNPAPTFTRGLIVTGSTNIAELTASLQNGYVWVGNASGKTTTVATSSFGGGGAAFPFTGSAQITGSLSVTGSVRGFTNTLSVAANTASINMNDGNFFRLNLPTGSITHVAINNLSAGQTINLLVSQSLAGTGSIAFAPNIRFAGGIDYTATAITGAMDIVSFVSFDTNQIFATQVKNLS